MLSVGFDISGLDLSFKEHAIRGIGRYVTELNKYFEKNPDPEVQVGVFDHQRLGGNQMIDRLVGALPAFRTTVRQQVIYPFRLNANGMGKFNLLHFPAQMDAPSWCPKRYVLTVLDLIPLVLKDMYQAVVPSWKFKFARWLELRAIKNAALILAISQNTANDLNRILGIPYERIVVTPLGVGPEFFEARLLDSEQELRQRLGVKSNCQIVLYVGGIDQRKNFTGLLHSFNHVVLNRREHGLNEPQLLMVGKIQNDKEFPRLMNLVRELQLQDHVVMPGYVNDRDLMQLYAISSVFFFPSLYEGFGLPPLEAMAAGTPVVSSSSSSIGEVLGDGGVKVDPTNHRVCAQEILAVLDHPDYALKLREAGKVQARNFSWERTGRTTLDAYRTIIS